MLSDWFNGIEILQGRWQHGEKVGYCYPSGLRKTLCKWDIYVQLVLKGLRHPICVRTLVHVCASRPREFSYVFLSAYESKQSAPQVLLAILQPIFSFFPFSYFPQLITTKLERELHTCLPIPYVTPDKTFVFIITVIINIINYGQLRFTSCSYTSLDNRIHQFFSFSFFSCRRGL